MAPTFPEIMRAIAALPVDCVLDAELVVPAENGLPWFERLRGRAVMKRAINIAAAAVTTPAALCVFDCLAIKGRDIRAKVLLERKAAIEPHLVGISGIQRVTFLPRDGELAYAAAVTAGIEGIVAKSIESPYKAGRSSAWLKIRNPGYVRIASAS